MATVYSIDGFLAFHYVLGPAAQGAKGGRMSGSMIPEIPVLGITGGPIGGKTFVLRALVELFGDRIVVVPEAATWLISNGFPPPSEHATLEEVTPFQRAVYAKVRDLERRAVLEARAKDALLILADRTSLDGAAYLAVEDQIATFGEMMMVDPATELRRYTEVVHLGSVVTISADLFERLKESDPETFRLEGPAQALKRNQDLLRICKLHPVHHAFDAAAGGIESKVDGVTQIAARLAGLKL